jgi:transcriptional regulator with XRE-family HTH domain
MVSPNIRRPLEPHEHAYLLDLGHEVRALREAAGVSCRYIARALLYNTRTVERIEQGTRRTRRSTLEALLDVLLLACPDLGERDELVQRLVDAAGPALAPESPHADKSGGRREGKRRRLEERRAMYRHLRE